jgi:hypothetical protein
MYLPDGQRATGFDHSGRTEWRINALHIKSVLTRGECFEGAAQAGV